MIHGLHSSFVTLVRLLRLLPNNSPLPPYCFQQIYPYLTYTDAKSIHLTPLIRHALIMLQTFIYFAIVNKKRAKYPEFVIGNYMEKLLLKSPLVISNIESNCHVHERLNCLLF